VRSCYLEYLSSLDDFSAGIRALDRLTQPRPVNGRNLKGVSAAPTYCRSSANPLPPPYPDNSPVCAISASSNASSAPIATIGRAAIAAGRRLTEHTIIPALD
jgi:hypothetical protein